MATIDNIVVSVDDTAIRAVIANYIERYAERLVNGPAVKQYAFPINREREEPDVAQAVRKHLRAVAAGVRAGLDPEHDWPIAPGSVAHGP